MYFLGRISPLHRSSSASRQDLRLHLVQPAGRKEKIFQEAREEDELGGGEAVQGGIDGKERPSNEIIFLFGLKDFDVY